MKAIVIPRYGDIDILGFMELEIPQPEPAQILVRVHASSINPVDFVNLSGKPKLLRLRTGLRAPKNNRPGTDFSGVVEAVGSEVTDFRPGDAVYGASRGAFAEYLVTAGKAMAPKPEEISFEQAAAVPVAGFTALQALRDHGGLQPGQRVLINGGAGGVGTFTVQVARAMGAQVTAVTSTRNVEMVRALGAERVIDYKKEDFTKLSEQFDLIVDNVGNHRLDDCLRLVKPDGAFVLVAGSFGRIFQVLTRRRFSKKPLDFFIARSNSADLLTLNEWLASGQVVPEIEKTYPLAEVPEAMKYQATKHARAKLVIRMV